MDFGPADFQTKVSGIVTDRGGEPLSGVNIVVESKDNGAISGLDGSFSIEAAADHILVFSILGYRSERVNVAGREYIVVRMEEDVTALGEVVLNAGYYTVSEQERTGNIATFNSEVMEKQPVANPLAAMR